MGDLNQARRLAERFARLLDGGDAAAAAVQDPELADELALVDRLRATGAVRPSADFSATLRQELLEQAAGLRAPAGSAPEDATPPDTPAPTPPPKRRGSGRLIAGATAFVMLGGGIGSAAAAAQGSMPGDTLYSLKRGLEVVASSVSVTEDSRGRRDLSHALTRLTEVDRLVDAHAEPSLISHTMQDFSDQALAGTDHLLVSYRQDADTAQLDKIVRFSNQARDRLNELAARVPLSVRPAIAQAVATVGELSERATRACPSCLAPGATTSAAPTTSPPGNGGSATAGPAPPTAQPTPARTPGAPALPTPTVAPPSVPALPPLPSLPLPSLPLPSLPLPTSGGLPSVGVLPLPTFSLPTLSLPLPPMSMRLPPFKLAPLLQQPVAASVLTAQVTGTTVAARRPTARRSWPRRSTTSASVSGPTGSVPSYPLTATQWSAAQTWSRTWSLAWLAQLAAASES